MSKELQREACLHTLEGCQVGAEVGGQHSGQSLCVRCAHFMEDLGRMLAQEGHQVFLLQQHILLQDLDVCLGLPQLVNPAPQQATYLHTPACRNLMHMSSCQ